MMIYRPNHYESQVSLHECLPVILRYLPVSDERVKEQKMAKGSDTYDNVPNFEASKGPDADTDNYCCELRLPFAPK